MPFVINSILIFIVLFHLVGCKSTKESNELKKGYIKTVEENRTWNNENETVITSAPGFFVVGMETSPIAPGFIPSAVFDGSALDYNQIFYNVSYVELPNDQSCLKYDLVLKKGDADVASCNTGRAFTLMNLTLYKAKKIKINEGVFKVEFGKLERSGIKHVIVIYYSDSLEALKRTVPISDSVPLWDWAPTIVQSSSSL